MGEIYKVLWNNEMNLCIGLRTELDREEFIEELERTHYELSGDALSHKEGKISVIDDMIWKFEY
ncbi:MAG: hypothetical protein AB2421_17810 [Thermotaleaceae bacterium]